MCRVDHGLQSRGEKMQPLTAAACGRLDEKSVNAALSSSWWCVHVRSGFPPISSFLLPLSFWKGQSIAHHLPTSAEIFPREISCLSGQDWHSVQMSEHLVFTFPISATSRTVRGGLVVIGDWWRSEPFRHYSLQRVWQDSHIKPSWSEVKHSALRSDYPPSVYVFKIKYLSPAGLKGWQFVVSLKSRRL